MSKQIVIAEQHRIAAVFEGDQIQELVVATGTHQVSDIYLGVVENVLPGIDAAFVNIGDSDRNGFIHVTDLGPLRLRRAAASITELLAPQQKVLVQVMKEPTGTKGPRLTGNVSLPGRYLVLMPNGRGVNLSRRISSENERNRLRALAILMKPAGMGVVIRTEAEGIPEEAIIEDLENLQKQWESVLQEASSTRAPALLNRDDDFVQRVLRDAYSNEVNRIVVDSVQGMKRVKQHLTSWSGGRMPIGILVDQHRERTPILEYFRVNAAIREAMKPRVDLPSGGYIIIEKTEALTVIDVNSGSFTRSATARETVLWTNCESATEIARQLRLRNIAGVIIVDFIDMESRRDQLQVLEHFNNAMQLDKAKPQIAQLTELGLVELTRKRQGKNIYELFGSPCPTCNGIGLHVHLPGEAASALQVNHQYHHYEEIPDHFAPPGAAIAPPPYGTEPSREGTRGRREGGRREVGRDAGREPGRDAGRDGKRSETRFAPTREPFAAPDPYSLPETANYEGDSDSDLELMHHPSYQERQRGGGNNNNRRRRRRGEAPYEREATPGRTASPWDEDGGDRSRYGVATPTREAASSQRFEEEEPEEDRNSPVPEPRETREREPREDRRNRGRRDRFPAEPPEVISVEMTSEEQDVYAWMGISPLVLSSQVPKNPRSTVIAVYLPGEAPPAEAEPEAGSVAEVEAIPVEQPEFDLQAIEHPRFDSGSGYGQDEEEMPSTRLRRSRSGGVVTPPVKRVIGITPRSEVQETEEPSVQLSLTSVDGPAQPTIVQSSESEDLEDDGAPRRRRRRSSAAT
jgi:ribonuclease E